jgi:hypothetical protein
MPSPLTLTDWPDQRWRSSADSGFHRSGSGCHRWRIPAPKPVRVTVAVLADLPSSSVFGSGVTLFAAVPDHRNPPSPRVFGCTVSKWDDAPIEEVGPVDS